MYVLIFIIDRSEVLCLSQLLLLLIDSVQILLNGDYKVKDGGLTGEYKAVRMDFHWGRDDQNGSEHLINGTRFPMEVIIRTRISHHNFWFDVQYNVYFALLLLSFLEVVLYKFLIKISSWRQFWASLPS